MKISLLVIKASKTCIHVRGKSRCPLAYHAYAAEFGSLRFSWGMICVLELVIIEQYSLLSNIVKMIQSLIL